MPHGVSTTKKTGSNIRAITIADNVPEHWERLIDIAKSNYSWFAYIYHNGDNENSSRHLHLLCYDKGGTTLKAHIGRFEDVVPGNFVNVVISIRAMARYLTHKDNPEKEQYKIDDVVTNDYDKLLSYYKDSSASPIDLWQDYNSLADGRITAEEFIDKYRSDIYSMPMYQKFSIIKKIREVCSRSSYIDSYFGGANQECSPPTRQIS